MKKMDLQQGKLKRQDGFTLLEVIVAISILMTGLLAVGMMQVSAIYGNSLARKITTGTSIAEDKIDELLSLQYTLLSTHDDLTEGNHPDAPTADAAGYTTTWTIVNNSPFANTKTITVTVTWKDKWITKSTSLSSFLARS